MQVKIDTSERFHVITIQESVVSANMTEVIENKLSAFLKEPVKNVVLNLEMVQIMDKKVLECLTALQKQFYDQKASFINCCLGNELKKKLSAEESFDLLNTAPTISEAGDLVQMEEIERELEEE